jgi:hypothetical protein
MLTMYEIVGAQVDRCAVCFTETFSVYSAKRFPGMEGSTELSKSFAEQGIRIRIRRPIRMRRRVAAEGSVEQDDRQATPQATAVIQEPAAKRPRTMDAHPQVAYTMPSDAGAHQSQPQQAPMSFYAGIAAPGVPYPGMAYAPQQPLPHHYGGYTGQAYVLPQTAQQPGWPGGAMTYDQRRIDPSIVTGQRRDSGGSASGSPDGLASLQHGGGGAGIPVSATTTTPYSAYGAYAAQFTQPGQAQSQAAQQRQVFSYAPQPQQPGRPVQPQQQQQQQQAYAYAMPQQQHQPSGSGGPQQGAFPLGQNGYTYVNYPGVTMSPGQSGFFETPGRPHTGGSGSLNGSPARNGHGVGGGGGIDLGGLQRSPVAAPGMPTSDARHASPGFKAGAGAYNTLAPMRHHDNANIDPALQHHQHHHHPSHLDSVLPRTEDEAHAQQQQHAHHYDVGVEPDGDVDDDAYEDPLKGKAMPRSGSLAALLN